MSELDAIRERHFQDGSDRPYDQWCDGCRANWPCDTRRVLDALDAAIESKDTRPHCCKCRPDQCETFDLYATPCDEYGLCSDHAMVDEWKGNAEWAATRAVKAMDDAWQRCIERDAARADADRLADALRHRVLHRPTRDDCGCLGCEALRLHEEATK